MGNKFELLVWDGPINGPYNWLEIYRGESLLKALYYLFWTKRQGWKCIKLEWRP